MELRSALLPPVLDAALLQLLASLADQLDGAHDDVHADTAVATFNRLAGTTLTFKDFQGLYKSVAPEEFVRDVLFQQACRPCADITHAELAEIVRRTQSGADDADFYRQLFLVNCKHPCESDLLYYPDTVAELPHDREPTPEEIATVALHWEPRIVAMGVAERIGGPSIGYFAYTLEAPHTPTTHVTTPYTPTPHERGATLIVALKGVRLPDGTTVATTDEIGSMSCGVILAVTTAPVGTCFTVEEAWHARNAATNG